MTAKGLEPLYVQRLRVDLGTRLGTGRKALKYISGQLFAQGLRYLAAAGVVDAEKRHPGLFSPRCRERTAPADALVVPAAV